jgi:hypothetical protein
MNYCSNYKYDAICCDTEFLEMMLNHLGGVEQVKKSAHVGMEKCLYVMKWAILNLFSYNITCGVFSSRCGHACARHAITLMTKTF